MKYRVGGLLISLALAACSEPDRDSATLSSGQSHLQDLTEFSQFTQAFDAGEGAPRLVLLLSPT